MPNRSVTRLPLMALAVLLAAGPASGPADALDRRGAAGPAESPPSEPMPRQKPVESAADAPAPRAGSDVDPTIPPGLRSRDGVAPALPAAARQAPAPLLVPRP